MSKLVWSIMVNSLGIYLITFLLPSITVTRPWVPLLAGLLLSLLSITIRPIILVLSLPLSLLSLGAFVLIVNTWMLQLTDLLVQGLKIPGFWTALSASLVIMLLNYLAARGKHLLTAAPHWI